MWRRSRGRIRFGEAIRIRSTRVQSELGRTNTHRRARRARAQEQQPTTSTTRSPHFKARLCAAQVGAYCERVLACGLAARVARERLHDQRAGLRAGAVRVAREREVVALNTGTWNALSNSSALITCALEATVPAHTTGYSYSVHTILLSSEKAIEMEGLASFS